LTSSSSSPTFTVVNYSIINGVRLAHSRIFSFKVIGKPFQANQSLCASSLAIKRQGCFTISLYFTLRAADAAGPLTGKIAVPEETMTSFLLVQVPPVYPVSAKQMHVEGTVILHIIVGKDGVVTSANAISGPDELRTTAVDAVRRRDQRKDYI
jgi:hypothetical protein